MSKYGNVRSGKYASKREARRGQELRLLANAAKIFELREQVKYELIPAQYIAGKCVERGVTYTADYVYDVFDKSTARGLRTVVEDCKGVKTQQYVIRRKLMLWIHHVRVQEV
jgi:hypothetical protein